MQQKQGRNQIHGDGMDFHQMKMQSMAREMI